MRSRITTLRICSPAPGHGAASERACRAARTFFTRATPAPIRLFVTVRVPQVIPGVAEIQIRSESKDVRAIRVVPMRLAGPGSNLPPTPDLAVQSKDDPQFFTASLWLMESGALQVRVLVDGAQGQGEVSVPVPSSAQRTLPDAEASCRAFAGAHVAAGRRRGFHRRARSCAKATWRAAKLPSDARNRRARRAMVVTAVLVAVLLFLGKAWWGSNACDFQRRVDFFKPPAAALNLVDGHRLEIRVERADTRRARRISVRPAYLHLGDVIPDHGHLMHLFLSARPGIGRHVAPSSGPSAGERFAVDLPDMPAGRYQVFADVVDPRGYPWTLVGSDRPSANFRRKASGRRRFHVVRARRWSRLRPNSTSSPLADGGRIVWQRPAGPLKAGVPVEFTFAVQDKDGRARARHGALHGHGRTRRICAVRFKRLCACASGGVGLNGGVGTGGRGDWRTAATPRNRAMPMPMAHPCRCRWLIPGRLPPEVRFPYGFPRAGDYRIFVQVKRAGRVETGVFDAHVQ